MRLFLDDVEDVHRLLGESCDAVSLHAGSALADTSDDLRGATAAELRDVRLLSQSPDIVVQLGRTSVIYTTDGRAGAWELAARVEMLLKPHTGADSSGAMPLFALLCALAVVGIEQLVQWQYGAAAVAGLFLLAIGIRVKAPGRRSRGGKVVVEPLRRSEAYDAARERKQQIRIALVTASVSIPVALVAAWLTDFFGLK